MCLWLKGSSSECSTPQMLAISLVLIFCVFFGAWAGIWLCTRRKGQDDTNTDEPLPSPADEAESLPPNLCIDSPNAMRCCEGEYNLVVEDKYNQQPCWLKKDGSRLILSGSDGHWYVARIDFTRVVWFICSQRPHSCVLPHKVAGGWAIKRNFRWRVDSSIAVQAPTALLNEDYVQTIPLDREMLEINLNDQWFCSGHGRDNSDLSTTTSSNMVMSEMSWWISCSATDLSAEFEAESASRTDTRCTRLDKVDTASAMSMSYQTVAKAPRKMDDCHAFGPGACPVEPPAQRRLPPRLPPQAVRFFVPAPQSSCSGLYVFMPNEQPNGRPLWRQKIPEPVHWLFCSSCGRWCIAGPDVQRECFSRAAGFVAQTCPSGPDIFPHDCETLWQLWDSDKNTFQMDSAIQVTKVDLTSSDIDCLINDDANSFAGNWKQPCEKHNHVVAADQPSFRGLRWMLQAAQVKIKAFGVIPPDEPHISDKRDIELF